MEFDLYNPSIKTSSDDENDDVESSESSDLQFDSNSSEDNSDMAGIGLENDETEIQNTEGASSVPSSSVNSSLNSSSVSGEIQSKEKGSENVKVSRGVLPEYKRLSKFGVLCWFVKRNFISLSSRFVLVVLFVWLFLFGGFVWSLTKLTGGIQSLASSSEVQEVASSDSSSVESQESSIEIEDNESSEKSVSSISEDNLKNVSGEKDEESKTQDNKVYLTLFAMDKVYTNNGDCLKVGDIINEDSPILQGYDNSEKVFVVSINYRNCCVLLSNGVVLRMRKP